MDLVEPSYLNFSLGQPHLLSLPWPQTRFSSFLDDLLHTKWELDFWFDASAYACLLLEMCFSSNYINPNLSPPLCDHRPPSSSLPHHARHRQLFSTWVWLVSLSWHLIVALYDHYGFNMSYLSCCVVNAIRVETIHVCLFFIVHYIIIVLLHCLLIMFITSIEQILWQHIIYYLVHNRYFAVF